MKTTIEIKGIPEKILENAVKAGIARSKTDAIRIGILSLGSEYKLIDQDMEDFLVVKKLEEEERANRKAGKLPETLSDVLKRYPELKNVRR